jgi:hypothetical protein
MIWRFVFDISSVRPGAVMNVTVGRKLYVRNRIVKLKELTRGLYRSQAYSIGKDNSPNRVFL